MVYVVRKTFDDINSEIYRNTNKDLAIEFCNKKMNYNVYNLDTHACIHKSTCGNKSVNKEKEINREAIITNPLGTYIKASASYNAKRLVKVPLKAHKVIVIDDKIVNGHYHARALYKNNWYYGYILADHLRLI